MNLSLQLTFSDLQLSFCFVPPILVFHSGCLCQLAVFFPKAGIDERGCSFKRGKQVHLYAVTVAGVCQMPGFAAQGNPSRILINVLVAVLLHLPFAKD